MFCNFTISMSIQTKERKSELESSAQKTSAEMSRQIAVQACKLDRLALLNII